MRVKVGNDNKNSGHITDGDCKPRPAQCLTPFVRPISPTFYDIMRRRTFVKTLGIKKLGTDYILGFPPNGGYVFVRCKYI
jgi:hypothetical protein